MTVFMDERDIRFCVDAIKLIKDSNATFIKKDTSITNDKYIELYKDSVDEIVVKVNEMDYIKESSDDVKESDSRCRYQKQPYKGSSLLSMTTLEKRHLLEQAKELLKRWIDTEYDREELLRLTEKFLNIEG